VRVALFITCIGDTVTPEVGRATVTVLERLGHEVSFPAAQTCCGQMHVNSGYRAEADRLAARFMEVFDACEVIV
jgi:L-lactate dehydrogenase complex protein LldE